MWEQAREADERHAGREEGADVFVDGEAEDGEGEAGEERRLGRWIRGGRRQDGVWKRR
jgi:hypothetical protein